MPPDWDFLLLTYLHDPPSKALDIRGHEGRATELANLALGEEMSRQALHDQTRTEDIIASMMERVVPLPTAGEHGERAVGVEDGRLRVIHPLSSQPEEIAVAGLEGPAEQQTLSDIVGTIDPIR